ncbi:MAG TPA: hypothetical protein VMR81_04825 [Patescibacteria group bacterium]|nr:hypothetical protein [Patescibacteria group bacterium]
MAAIEFADVKPKDIDLTGIPTGWNILSEAEHSLAWDFLSGRNTETLRSIITMEGRNTFILRPGSPDPIYTHIQLSGGFYKELEISRNGMAISKNTVHLLSADNFVLGREPMFRTNAITEDGQITTTQPDYVPTGAYTQMQAIKKAIDTLSITASLEKLKALDFPDKKMFMVPRIVGVYQFPEVTDPTGEPVYGIAMLTSSPENRLSQRINSFFNRYGKHYEASINRRIQRNFGYQTVALGAAIRTLHDSFDLYHRQITSGNCEIVTLPDNQFTPFFHDWSTTMRLPKNLRPNRMARAIDLIIPWASVSILMDHMRETGATNNDVAQFMTTSFLANLTAGYVHLLPRRSNEFEKELFSQFTLAETDSSTVERLANFITSFDATIGVETEEEI